MTGPGGASSASTHVADGYATVGVQADTFHGDVHVYQVPPDAPPQRHYEAGVAYLEGGMPQHAREEILEAVRAGYVSDEVTFHWLLALLSGRTLQQLTAQDLTGLRRASGLLSAEASGPWADGVKVIIRLLDQVEEPDADTDTVVKEFDELGSEQRGKIAQHLEQLLTGSLEDHLWQVTVGRVKAGQLANDRLGRIWKFFQPEPAGPRVVPVRPVTIDAALRLRTVAATLLFALSGVYLGWLVVQRWEASGILAYLASVVLGWVCAVNGAEWRFRIDRLRVKDRQYLSMTTSRAEAPAGGFAHQIDDLFGRYAGRYVPDGVDRETWLSSTAGIRQSLRDEVVEAYREERVRAKQVAWLVRYLISDVKERWRKGTLWEYRDRLRTRTATKAAFTLGLLGLVPGVLWAAAQAVLDRPFLGVLTVLALAATGRIAAGGWLHVRMERQRFAEETAEAARELARRTAAYQRWQAKLADRPTDAEMAAWLECDRRLLMDRAMRHYKLAARDVIAHAFLQTPEGRRRRARVPRGPWRYGRYELILFLLTADGVRQVTAVIDVERVSCEVRRRANYRFDAVATVRVSEEKDGQTFELTLLNRDKVTVAVSERDDTELPSGESSQLVSQLSQDAAGLATTLHVLEGIAAEGRQWINLERQRELRRIPEFRAALRGLLAEPGRPG